MSGHTDFSWNRNRKPLKIRIQNFCETLVDECETSYFSKFTMETQTDLNISTSPVGMYFYDIPNKRRKIVER